MASCVLTVYETEDESLLCQVSGRWGLVLGWIVRDADGCLVGRLTQTKSDLCIEDHQGQLLTCLHWLPDHLEGRFVTPRGIELGTLDRLGSERRLTFGPELEGAPFNRMLLLAAALTDDIR